MKIKELSAYRPLILGDLAQDTSQLAKLSDAEILARQPESTKRLLQMSAEEHAEFHASDIKYIKMEADAHKLRPDMVDEDGEYTQKAKDLFKERQQRSENGNFRTYYRADKSSIIRADNLNGDIKDETSELKKKLAKDAFENQNPKWDPLIGGPLEEITKPKEKKSVFGTIGDLFKKEEPLPNNQWTPHFLRKKNE